jgi:hypothetical protein
LLLNWISSCFQRTLSANADTMKYIYSRKCIKYGGHLGYLIKLYKDHIAHEYVISEWNFAFKLDFGLFSANNNNPMKYVVNMCDYEFMHKLLNHVPNFAAMQDKHVYLQLTKNSWEQSVTCEHRELSNL